MHIPCVFFVNRQYMKIRDGNFLKGREKEMYVWVYISSTGEVLKIDTHTCTRTHTILSAHKLPLFTLRVEETLQFKVAPFSWLGRVHMEPGV